MKVLRDAVLRERQEKDALTKTNNDFAAEVERLRIQIQEKVLNNFSGALIIFRMPIVLN